MLASYQDFLRAVPPEGADLGAADKRLGAFLDAHVVAGRSPSARLGGASFIRRMVDWRVSRWRPALAAFAAVAVVVVSVYTWQARRTEQPHVFRRATTNDFALGPAELLSDKTVRLSWNAYEGADAYEVRLYAADLTDVARLGPLADTEVVVDLARVYPAGKPGTSLYWRVTALAARDEIATSQAGSFEIR
jgi:hypothetical protein